jgi:hypothetical protein
MSYSMSEMIHIPASEPVSLPSDPLLVRLAVLFDDPLLHEAIHELRSEILRRLEKYLTGENSMTAERATMISARLKEATQDPSSVMIEMCMGEVIIVRNHENFILGQVSVPKSSQWARQAFINRNIVSNDVQGFVFTTYAMGRIVNPWNVNERSEGPEFLLSERQAIAAQILMVMHAAVRYRDLAARALNAENMDPELRMLVTEANKADLSRALNFAVELRQENRHKINAIPASSFVDNSVLASRGGSMTTLMSRFSETSS